MQIEPFRLMIVDYVFQHRDGVALFPGLVMPELPREVRSGDKLELRRPNGTRFSTVIAGIEHAKRADRSSAYPVRLASLSKEDVPLGTEVWWIAPNQS
jgi:hypothetical protein